MLIAIALLLVIPAMFVAHALASALTYIFTGVPFNPFGMNADRAFTFFFLAFASGFLIPPVLWQLPEQEATK